MSGAVHGNRADLTAVVLTYNEAANIHRCLDTLGWVSRVVVLDSGSCDDTVAIAARFPNVVVYQREFDNHAAQWNYAVHHTDIDSEWVMCLDADYRVPRGCGQRIRALLEAHHINGYLVSFDFVVDGTNIGPGLYGDVPVIARKDALRYIQEGHTQRARINGRVAHSRLRFIHDDRKPLSRWWASQFQYAELEANYLTQPGNALNWRDRLRVGNWMAPVLCFLYLMIVRGMAFKGRGARAYATERLIAEALLRLKIDLANAEKSQDPVAVVDSSRRQGARS